MKKIIAMLLACMMIVGLFAACAPAAQNNGTTEAEKITLTVWGPSEDQDPATGKWLQTMCEKFNAAHPEWDITFEYGVCGENDAATKVTQDVSAAADVFMYASDQLGTLMNAQALAQFGGANLDAIKANNSDAMVNTVTYTDGGVYGVPFTPNTWFMYYNKNTYTEEDVKSLETMLQKGKVAFNIGDAWYLASFFVANGGTLFGATGADATAGIQFGGANGEAVTNYLVDLVNNPNFINDKDNNVGLGLMAEAAVTLTSPAPGRLLTPRLLWAKTMLPLSCPPSPLTVSRSSCAPSPAPRLSASTPTARTRRPLPLWQCSWVLRKLSWLTTSCAVLLPAIPTWLPTRRSLLIPPLKSLLVPPTVPTRLSTSTRAAGMST